VYSRLGRSKNTHSVNYSPVGTLTFKIVQVSRSLFDHSSDGHMTSIYGSGKIDIEGMADLLHIEFPERKQRVGNTGVVYPDIYLAYRFMSLVPKFLNLLVIGNITGFSRDMFGAMLLDQFIQRFVKVTAVAAADHDTAAF
jgi:hypothetical protein